MVSWLDNIMKMFLSMWQESTYNLENYLNTSEMHVCLMLTEMHTATALNTVENQGSDSVLFFFKKQIKKQQICLFREKIEVLCHSSLSSILVLYSQASITCSALQLMAFSGLPVSI